MLIQVSTASSSGVNVVGRNAVVTSLMTVWWRHWWSAAASSCAGRRLASLTCWCSSASLRMRLAGTSTWSWQWQWWIASSTRSSTLPSTASSRRASDACCVCRLLSLMSRLSPWRWRYRSLVESLDVHWTLIDRRSLQIPHCWRLE